MDDDDLAAREDPSLAPYYTAAEQLRAEPEAVRRARLAGQNAALRDQAKGLGLSLMPGAAAIRVAGHAVRVAQATRRGGVVAGAKQAWSEYVDELRGLPLVHTYLEASAASDAQAAHDAYAEGYHRVNTGIGAANDAALLYGVARGVPAMRSALAKETVYNARTSFVQEVLNGIDPTELSTKARFGPAVYLAEQGETAVLEVKSHGGIASHVIRYDLRIGPARILDLTKPAIASEWGYTPTTSTTAYSASQALAERAGAAGYNVIKFRSVRGAGANYAVLSDFEQLLVPQGVSPAQP